MGDLNQLLFVDDHRDRLRGPILEIGSKDYGTTQNLRPRFRETEYVGVDMAEGPGVDHVLDMTRPLEEIDRTLGGTRFGTIICFSVLEHCANPFKMAENITHLLAPGGVLLVSVPFSWQFHGYPSDYWRFTHEGVKVLFPALTFDMQRSVIATGVDGDLRAIDPDLGQVRFSLSQARKAGRGGQALSTAVLKVLRTFGFAKWLLKYPYVMPPVMVSMIGTKKHEQTSAAA